MIEKGSKDLILALNQQVKEKVSKGIDVTNCVIGMFFDDNKKLPIPENLRTFFSKHVLDDDLIYGNVAGPKGLKEASLNWFFRGVNIDQSLSSSFEGMTTPGGTGAISLSLEQMCINKSAVLLPTLCWTNYYGMVKNCGADLFSYDLDNNDKFNVEGIKNIIESLDEYDSIVLLINEPCENPTGYELTNNDYINLEAMLKGLKNSSKVKLILDLAYIDFGRQINRQNVHDFVLKIKDSLEVCLAFSFSKTLSIYGLRLGYLFVSNNQTFKNYTAKARTRWSMSNTSASNAVLEILTNKDAAKSLDDALLLQKEELMARAKLFVKEANECGLSFHPYIGGFFISIYVKDAFASVNHLTEQNIYLVPFNGTTLRLSFGALDNKHIKGLAKKIKESDK